MKETKLFPDILELVDAIKQHNYTVVSNDDIAGDPPSLGFLAKDGTRFAISLEDYQESMTKYPPNTSNRKVALFSAAMRSEDGKKNFLKFVNEDKEDKPKKTEKKEPEGHIINDGELNKEFIAILDSCVKDFLTTVSTVSDDFLETWKTNSAYSMLLADVLNGNGPKELWLKVVLNHLEEHNGEIEK